MGLKELFSRWTKGEDKRARERAEEEYRMTPDEREVEVAEREARTEDELDER